MIKFQVGSRALKFGLVLALATFVLALSSPAMAQETTGNLRGVVVDPNGQAVANATVTEKSQSTGLTTSVTTTSEGAFAFTKLIPGKYTLTIETGSGFKKKSVTDIDVKLGDNSLGNIALDVGSPTETVTVTGEEEAIISRDTSMISASFNSRAVTELPSNAASFGLDTLALLVPGVAQNSGGGTNTNGAGLSVNGNRGRSNNFQIDGSDNNDLSVAGPNLFISNAEGVQEVQVVTNNYSAQYGRNLGSIVNYVTRSGGNRFHGSLFEYHLDERNLASLTNIERAGCTKPPCHPNRFLSNTFGGSVGGPIYIPHFGEGGKAGHWGKDRAFFFFTWQGIRQPSTTQILSAGLTVAPSDVPLLAATFPNSPVIQNYAKLAASLIGPGTVKPRSDLSNCNATTLRLSGAPVSQYALCNQDFIDFSNGTTTLRTNGFLIERDAPFNFTQTDYSMRFDVKVSKKDSVNARYIFQDGDQQNDLVGSNGFSGDLIFGTKNLGGGWVRQVNSHTVNEVRFVRTRLAVDFGGGCNPTTPGCIPSPSQIDAAQVESFNVSGVRGVTLTGNALRVTGLGGGLPQGRDTTLYDILDNLTWVHGKHSFIFGGEYKHTSAVVPFLPNYNGAYTFAILSGSTLAAQQARVFNNAPSAFSIALGNPNVAYTENDQYYFVQDDFKLRSNLTLNLGVRYEYTGQPIDSLTNFTIARESGPSPLFNPALPVAARIVPKVPADKNNFAPRVGFAYTPKFEHGFMHRLVGDDQTVIRGGYAIAYDPAFYNILLNIANSSPFSIALAASAAAGQLPSTNPLLPMPSNIFGASVRNFVTSAGILPIGKLDPKWLSQTTVAPNFRSPYSEQWSFGLQRQIGKNSVVEARYVGNHGVGLFQSVLTNPFVGIPGDPTLPLGTAGASSGFYGFSRNVCTAVNPTTGACTAQTLVRFPTFTNILPSGVNGLICTDIASTPDNEAACNGRIRAQGAVTDRENTATSWYHSAQFQYQGRFLKRSLNLGAAYTFSKTIDTSSEVFAFNSENSILPQNPFNLRADRGLSALHRPNIFSLNAIYDVPFAKAQNGWVGHLLGGWQINAVQVYNSGRRYSPSQLDNANILGLNGSNYLSGGESLRPFISNPSAPQTTVGISQIDAFFFGYIPFVTDFNGFLSLNNLNNGGTVANSVIQPGTVRFIYNGPGSARIFGSPYGNSPRYYLVGPPINQLNLGFFKNTRLFGESNPVTLQLRLEMFNALNHPNAGYGISRNSSLPSVSLDTAGTLSGPFADNNFINMARRWFQFGARLTF